MSEVASILKDYAAKMEALGSAAAIALHLQSREVKAECGSYSRCALAVDIKTILAERGITTMMVEVGSDINAYTRDFPHAGIKVPLGSAAHDFIQNFDNRVYPELIL